MRRYFISFYFESNGLKMFGQEQVIVRDSLDLEELRNSILKKYNVDQAVILNFQELKKHEK